MVTVNGWMPVPRYVRVYSFAGPLVLRAARPDRGTLRNAVAQNNLRIFEH